MVYMCGKRHIFVNHNILYVYKMSTQEEALNEEIKKVSFKIEKLEIQIEAAEKEVPRDRDYIIELRKLELELTKKENILRQEKIG